MLVQPASGFILTMKKPNAFVYDGAKGIYLPRIQTAAKACGWLISPYDNEHYARDDIKQLPDALVAGLSDFDYVTTFQGKLLLEDAKKLKVPTAVVSMPEREPSLRTFVPDALFVSNKHDVVEQLAGWLTDLSVQQKV